MTRSIEHLLPHPDQEQLHRLAAPSQMPRQQRHTHPLQPLHRVLQHPPPDLLLFLPLRPAADRPLDRLVPNVHESLLGQLLLELITRPRIDAHLRRSLHDSEAPFRERRVLSGAPVVTFEGKL